MTTEIDAEGLEAAIDAGAIDAPYGSMTYVWQIEKAIAAYLATTRTSEAEPVADPSFPTALSDSEVRIWINTCNHEPARQALRQLLAYRVRGLAQPLPTPASDDQVEALNLAAAALAPFASAVFNDNGDLTIDASAPTSKDLAAAYFALRKVRAALLAAMGSTKPAPRLDATVRSGEEG